MCIVNEKLVRTIKYIIIEEARAEAHACKPPWLLVILRVGESPVLIPPKNSKDNWDVLPIRKNFYLIVLEMKMQLFQVRHY